eukprot:1375091-Rhodomonas_salina.2
MQVEVVMDAKVSTKKAPAWTARIGAVVRELERAAVMNVDEGPGCEQTMAQVCPPTPSSPSSISRADAWFHRVGIVSVSDA